MTGHHSTLSDQTFTYDSAQRLTNVDDVRASDRTCVRRTYTYDAGGAGDSNRTLKMWWTSSPGGTCGTGTVARRGYGYDTADRITTTGWAWDAFGRATSVPAPDSGGSSTLTVAYSADDLDRQLTLDGRTQTYTRDPTGRASTIVSSGGVPPTITTTNEYADDTDSPVAAVRSDLTMASYVDGPDGELAATSDAGILTYQLDDVEGSVVADASSTTGGSGPISRTETDEFGNVRTGGTPVIDNTKGVPAYGWLGGHERATDFGQAQGSGGPVEMGARAYLPTVGRFLQVDPVDGGSANSYDYAFQNPMNVQDLSGQCPICVVAAIEGGEIVFAAAAGVIFTTGVVYVASRDGAISSLADIIRDADPFKFAKGGQQNWRHDHLGDMDARQLREAYKQATNRALRRKIQKQEKALKIRNEQKRRK